MVGRKGVCRQESLTAALRTRVLSFSRLGFPEDETALRASETPPVAGPAQASQTLRIPRKKASGTARRESLALSPRCGRLRPPPAGRPGPAGSGPAPRPRYRDTPRPEPPIRRPAGRPRTRGRCVVTLVSVLVRAVRTVRDECARARGEAVGWGLACESVRDIPHDPRRPSARPRRGSLHSVRA